MFSMAIEAAKQMANPEKELTGFVLKNTTFHSVFKVPTGATGIEASIHMRPRARRGQNEKDTGWHDFRIYAYENATDEWQEKCRGSVQLVYAGQETEVDAGQEAREWQQTELRRYADAVPRCTATVDVAKVYDGLQGSGYGYGPSFRAISSLSHDGADTAIAEVQTHRWPEGEVQEHVVHPATLDCVFQATLMAVISGDLIACGRQFPRTLNAYGSRTRGSATPTQR